jgi:hypothetical protein
VSRTKRKIPYWATPYKLFELVEHFKGISNAPAINPEREAFFHGYDKMGRKSSILDPIEREEV